jgi:hypothetical protein
MDSMAVTRLTAALATRKNMKNKIKMKQSQEIRNKK